MKRGKIALYIVACLDVILIVLSQPLGLVSAMVFNQTAHTLTTQYGWYCMPRADGLQPERNREFAFAYNYDIISIGSPDDKVIYITFDGGYENGYANTILDALKAHNAPAAFFLVGHYIKTQPEIVQRMLDEGHLICSHSMNHKNMAAMTDYDAFSKELSDLDDLLFEQTGHHIAKFFRPPEGNFSEMLLQYAQRCGYTTAFWSFAYKDWLIDAQPNTADAMNTVISRTHPGEVALLHITSATNAAILDDVLTKWESMGYRFGSLNDFAERSGPDI